MIVQCSQCSTKFRVNDANVGPRGAKVRCSRCQNVFTVAPIGAAPQADEDFASDRTHAFDTSQFMRAAMGAKAGAAPQKQAPVAPPALGTQPPSENSTTVVDAREFMKQHGAAAKGGASFDEPAENSTRLMSLPDIERLAAAKEAGQAQAKPLPKAMAGDDATHVASGMILPPEARRDVHEQATQVAALFSKSDATPWGNDAADAVPFNDAPAITSNIERNTAGISSLRLQEETVQAQVIQDIGLEAVALQPPPLMSWVVTGLCCLVLAVGLAVCVRGEAVYTWAAVRLGHAANVHLDNTVVNGLHLLSARSQLYPLNDTDVVWIVTGSVENTTQAAVRGVDVTAELHDRVGRVVAQTSAPVGLEIDPTEIPPTVEDLQTLLEKALRQVPPPGAAAGEQADFVAVLIDPPLPLPVSAWAQQVHLSVRPPLPPEAPPPPPEPAPAIAPEPAPVAVPAPAPHGRGRGKLKGLRGHKKAAVAPRDPVDPVDPGF